ncbi:MAG: nitrous oxide reductase accessory protein NosL [Chloroflexi bacterium]|nr:nitrous oxide reductase accessory protein NosL [Chloroflexota bacterium]
MTPPKPPSSTARNSDAHGLGLAAFANQADAEQFVAENGGVITTFAALQQEIASGALDPSSLTSNLHDHEIEDAANGNLDHDGHEE